MRFMAVVECDGGVGCVFAYLLDVGAFVADHADVGAWQEPGDGGAVAWRVDHAAGEGLVPVVIDSAVAEDVAGPRSSVHLV
jgi:uncharacterized phage protein gp47/JayE